MYVSGKVEHPFIPNLLVEPSGATKLCIARCQRQWTSMEISAPWSQALRVRSWPRMNPLARTDRTDCIPKLSRVKPVQYDIRSHRREVSADVESQQGEHESKLASGAFCRGHKLSSLDLVISYGGAWVQMRHFHFPSFHRLTIALCKIRMARPQEGDNVGGCWIRKRSIVQEVCFTSMHI